MHLICKSEFWNLSVVYKFNEVGCRKKPGTRTTETDSDLVLVLMKDIKTFVNA